jgi:hypothetical protein
MMNFGELTAQFSNKHKTHHRWNHGGQLHLQQRHQSIRNSWNYRFRYGDQVP